MAIIRISLFNLHLARAPRKDVLEKLANSVKRVAMRGTRTFAAIGNYILYVYLLSY